MATSAAKYRCQECDQGYGKLKSLTRHLNTERHMLGVERIQSKCAQKAVAQRPAPPPVDRVACILSPALTQPKASESGVSDSDPGVAHRYEDVLAALKPTTANCLNGDFASISDFLARPMNPVSFKIQSITLVNDLNCHTLKESAFLGSSVAESASRAPIHQNFHLNVHEPFCLVALGVQGAGKSHTMSVVLESCLTPTKHIPGPDSSLVNINGPMCALVLHFDQNPHSLCESTGLISPAGYYVDHLGMKSPLPSLKRDQMTVLVSPTYYLQRSAFYGSYCTIRPLLFSWKSLSADHIKKLMRINDNENQLYMATLLDLLRNFQRSCQKPSFSEFRERVVKLANVKGQEAPLIQRLNLLESFLLESEKNVSLRDHAVDLGTLIQAGRLIVVDLTDPMLSASEVNGVFQLVVEQFRVAPLQGCGKLVAVDEAHKFMDGQSSDGLGDAILDTVRLMRHDGVRVLLSTQSPRALRPEILELISVAVLHHFHSRDWFDYLQAKIPLGESDFRRIVGLEPGEAVVFAGRHLLESEGGEGMVGVAGATWKMRVRARFTADRGASRLSK
ncbi:hypothetical protein HDU77_007151 [Chytriomyces hyalinus]|nr:hypothetical protein HDU77_007151 [Chytriomyces hyalinus]